MSEFVAITSQEQLDSVIGDRLKRSEEKWQKKYEGFVSPTDFEEKTKGMQSEIDILKAEKEALTTKNAEFEKNIKTYQISDMRRKIADENGISHDAVDFIQGDDEESMKASAEKLKSLIVKPSFSPSFRNEPAVNEEKNGSMVKLARSLSKNN